ncbi:MAG: hypothetical protein HY726_20560 [Candidatus Rokubacteria bacterium]|nr:hypothetical protein [Candidatus Rokubacteria bacterium]
MERSLADLVVFEVIPVVRAALKEAAELTLALDRLAERVDHLSAELAEGELRELRKLVVNALRALETAQIGGGS